MEKGPAAGNSEILPVVLRPAELRDVPSLRQIRHDAIIKLAAAAYGTDGAAEWASSGATDRVRRAVRNHLVTLAKTNKEPVGWVEQAADCVLGLYVDPGHSRQGIGRLLMSHAEEQMQHAGIETAVLHASRNAEPFYVACGYRRTGEHTSSEGVPMAKRIRQ